MSRLAGLGRICPSCGRGHSSWERRGGIARMAAEGASESAIGAAFPCWYPMTPEGLATLRHDAAMAQWDGVRLAEAWAKAAAAQRELDDVIAAQKSNHTGGSDEG